MTTAMKTMAAVIATCAVVLASGPTAAVDGEILLNQAAVNTGGISPGDAPGFPATLSRRGRYKLAGNLSASAGQNGIEVTQADIAIDLNGFTLSSNSPSQPAFGISARNITGLRVMNGTITGFQSYAIL